MINYFLFKPTQLASNITSNTVGYIINFLRGNNKVNPTYATYRTKLVPLNSVTSKLPVCLPLSTIQSRSIEYTSVE